MDEFMDEYDEKNRLKGDKKIPFGQFVRRVFTYLKPEWPRFLLAGLLLALNVFLDILLPLFLSRMTDRMTPDSLDLRYLITMAVAYLGICLINNVFYYAESMLLQRAGQEIIYALRMDVFSHIEELSRNQFAEMPVGSLVTRVTSYTQSMSDLFTNVIVSVIKNFLMVFGVYVIMFFINVQMTLVLLIPLALIFTASVIFSKYVGGAFREERKKVSELNTFLNENLSGMGIIQIFNRQEKKLGEFDEKNTGLRRARFNVIKGFGCYRPFVTLVHVATIALIFWIGIRIGQNAGRTEIVMLISFSRNFYG